MLKFMKKLYFCLLLLLLGTAACARVANQTPTKTSPIQASNELITISQLAQTGCTINDYFTTEVDLETWGRVKFIACENNSAPPALQLYLANENDQIIYTFPNHYGLDMDWTLEEINSVDFQYLNADELTDIVVTATFYTGIGPTGAEAFLVTEIYFQTSRNFMLNRKLDDALNQTLTTHNLEAVSDFVEKTR